MIKRIYMVLILSVFSLSGLKSQYYSTGQDPYSIKWKQINTEHFQIIFPQEYAVHANRIANILQSSIKYVGTSLNHVPKKQISVVVHSNTAASNGLVAWAPRRMELYPTIDDDPDPGEWLKHLAIHESRHVVQIDKLNQGVARLLYYLFGEQITGLILGLYVPLWLLEGDAVATETALTISGRGRKASFTERLKPILAEDLHYSYDKAAFGSYKDYIPNHYVFGYHFNSYVRTKYNNLVWDSVFTQVYKNPFSVTPINIALRKATGKTKTELFSGFKDSLKQNFKHSYQENENVQYYEHQPAFYNYYSPVVNDNNELFAIRTSLDKIARIVHIKDNNESIIYIPGFLNNNKLNVSNDKLVWTETVPDIRWHNRDFSVIKVYDIKSKKTKTIGGKSQYYHPDVYNNLLCVVELKDVKSVIKVYDLSTSEVIDSIAEKGLHFVQPRFVANNKLVSVVHTNTGHSIGLIDLNSKTIKYFTDKTVYEIKDPVLIDTNLYFIWGKEGTNNIYVRNLNTNSLSKITDVEYGVNDLNYNELEKELVFTEYKSNGYHIAKMNIENTDYQTFEIREPKHLFAEELKALENGPLNDDQITNYEFEIEKYSRFKNLLNIHSWAAAYTNINDYEFNPGVTLLSQNVLNTSFVTLSYERDLGLNADIYTVDWSYRGFYPRIDNALSYTEFNTTYVTHDHDFIDYSIQQTSYDVDLSVPLNLTRSKFLGFLQPRIGQSLIYREVSNIWKDSVFNGTISSLEYGIYASYTLKKAHKHLYPRLGIVSQFEYNHTPFNDNNLGEIILTENRIYLPGIHAIDNIQLHLGYQLKRSQKYQYADQLSIARGYLNPANDKLLNLSGTYSTPLMHPDWSIFFVSYIKRIYTNIFHDYSVAYHPNYDNKYYHTTGIDIISDMHIFRTVVPIKFGLRSMYLYNDNDFRFEFIFRLDVSSL